MTCKPTAGRRALCAGEQAELLRAARRAIVTHLQHGRRAETDAVNPVLLDPAGAFVTLHCGERLRGCIGTFEADGALIHTVARMAVSAATMDPRFPPLRDEELADLRIEISVLSPRQVAKAEDLVVGEHGVYLAVDGRRGVLLPQVALEAGWDRMTFLDATCRKAGLPAGAWRQSDAVIELFTAQVFGEPPGR